MYAAPPNGTNPKGKIWLKTLVISVVLSFFAPTFVNHKSELNYV